MWETRTSIGGIAAPGFGVETDSVLVAADNTEPYQTWSRIERLI